MLSQANTSIHSRPRHKISHVATWYPYWYAPLNPPSISGLLVNTCIHSTPRMSGIISVSEIIQAAANATGLWVWDTISTIFKTQDLIVNYSSIDSLSSIRLEASLATLKSVVWIAAKLHFPKALQLCSITKIRAQLKILQCMYSATYP